MTANRIRELRKERGMNQKELGNILKVGQTTVSAWETGRNEPDNSSLHQMAKMFNCSIGYLMGYENSERRGLTEAQWQKYQAKLARIAQREYDIPQINEFDPEEMELQKHMDDYETNEAWEKAGLQVFRESIEIDQLFENRNLNTDDRKRAVEILKLAFPEK